MIAVLPLASLAAYANRCASDRRRPVRRILQSLSIALLFCTALYAEDIDLPHVMVSGTATMEVPPDEMIWSLDVKNEGADLPAVAEEHSKIVGEVLQFLNTQMLPKESIQTSRMEFGVGWRFEDRSRIKDGYYSSTHISFKLKAFDKYRKLWIGLSKFSSVSVTDVSYDSSKRIEYQNEARKKALLAARKKAESLARTLGSEIGEPLMIEEDFPGSSWHPGNATIEVPWSEANSGGLLALGSIPIQTTVKVAFRLITHN